MRMFIVVGRHTVFTDMFVGVVFHRAGVRVMILGAEHAGWWTSAVWATIRVVAKRLAVGTPLDVDSMIHLHRRHVEENSPICKQLVFNLDG